MTAWERFVYACALAFWRAFWEVWRERGHAVEEAPNADDQDARRRAVDLIARELRVQAGGTPGPTDPAPGR